MYVFAVATFSDKPTYWCSVYLAILSTGCPWHNEISSALIDLQPIHIVKLWRLVIFIRLTDWAKQNFLAGWTRGASKKFNNELDSSTTPSPTALDYSQDSVQQRRPYKKRYQTRDSEPMSVSGWLPSSIPLLVRAPNVLKTMSVRVGSTLFSLSAMLRRFSINRDPCMGTAQHVSFKTILRLGTYRNRVNQNKPSENMTSINGHAK